MRKQIGTRLLLILLTCAFSCSENGSVTGGGTDFPNTRTVAGVVLSSEGFPAKGVEVTAFNTHHNPLHGSEDTYPAVTDSSGIFHLSLPERGEFNLMAKSGNGTMGFKNRTVSVWDSPDTVRLATPGCALVVVRGTGTRSVYIRGTGFVSQVASGIATFDSLPAGTLPQIRTNGDASLSETLPVSSGEISTIADILFITGQDKAGTEAGDVELIGQLLKSGARVSAAEQTEIDSGRIDGCDVICISSSADTSGLPHRLSTVAKPLLNFNPLLQPGLYMTDTAEHIDFGTENNYFVVSLGELPHPISAGIDRTVSLFRSPVRIDWGKPSADAEMIATLPGIVDQAVIYAYDSGARMVRTHAPAKRGFFPLRQQYLSDVSVDGWRIVRRMIAWSVQ